jgi:hypothetical protein
VASCPFSTYYLTSPPIAPIYQIGNYHGWVVNRGKS